MRILGHDAKDCGSITPLSHKFLLSPLKASCDSECSEAPQDAYPQCNVLQQGQHSTRHTDGTMVMWLQQCKTDHRNRQWGWKLGSFPLLLSARPGQYLHIDGGCILQAPNTTATIHISEAPFCFEQRTALAA